MNRRIMRILINTFLVLPAAFFLTTAFRWLVSPAEAAEALMMPLLHGSAMGSQMGDIGGMFLALGVVVMGAVVTRTGAWLVPVSVVLGSIVLFRLLAFSLYGAPLLLQAIVFELVLAIWFAFASRLVAPEEPSRA